MPGKTKIQPRRIDPLLAAAIILLLIAVALLWAWPDAVGGDYRDLAAGLVGSAGIALLVTSLVERKHLAIALGATAEGIVSGGAQELDRAFHESFSILNQSDVNGLLSIYPPRQQKDPADTLKSAIQSDIRRTKNLDIVGISGLDFFSYPRSPSTQPGAYYDACKARLEGRSEETASPLQIRALLLNPASDAARLREAIETIEGETPDISADIETATKGMDKLNQSAREGAVHWAFYDPCPQVWAVLTDDSVFVEPYHLAPTAQLCQDLRADDLEASQVDVNCTGGRVPVLQFRRHSNMYCALRAHFEFLWDLAHGSENLQVAHRRAPDI